MMKSRVRITTILLFAASLRYHYCNAAAPTSFVKRKTTITVPHLKRQIDTSSLLSSALGEVESLVSSSFTTSAAGNDVNFETSTTAVSTFSSNKRFKSILRGGGNNILLSSSTILSTITTILTQSLNIATAALVGSGYVGCYIASFIIAQLHRYCTTATTITTNNNGGSSLWKWKWTILATITHLLSLSNHNHHDKNLIFLPTLWGYSHQINPTLGGIIGCTHLLLGGLSSLLGSQTVVNTLSELMDVRLPPLDEHGNMSYNIDTFLQEQQSNKNQSVVAGKEMLVRIFSSLDIFTSFPRDCLSLYLGSCALLTYWSSTKVMGETKLGMMSWWMNGLLLSSGGQSAIGEDTAATAAAAVMVDRKMITTRLFALHWIIMVVKGTSSLFLQLL